MDQSKRREKEKEGKNEPKIRYKHIPEECGWRMGGWGEPQHKNEKQHKNMNKAIQLQNRQAGQRAGVGRGVATPRFSRRGKIAPASQQLREMRNLFLLFVFIWCVLGVMKGVPFLMWEGEGGVEFFQEGCCILCVFGEGVISRKAISFTQNLWPCDLVRLGR